VLSVILSINFKTDNNIKNLRGVESEVKKRTMHNISILLIKDPFENVIVVYILPSSFSFITHLASIMSAVLSCRISYFSKNFCSNFFDFSTNFINSQIEQKTFFSIKLFNQIMKFLSHVIIDLLFIIDTPNSVKSCGGNQKKNLEG
jgi:hypothetical protein